MNDVALMRRALFHAARAVGATTPNPMVGAVIVDADGVVVGQGRHERAGGPHAEVNALDEAADGHLAMERIRLAPPDLLFLDLNIPGTSGAEVLHAVKTDPATASMRVIVVTATGEEGRASALRLGADEYFTKPFSPTALLRTVEKVLASGGSPGA